MPDAADLCLPNVAHIHVRLDIDAAMDNPIRPCTGYWVIALSEQLHIGRRYVSTGVLLPQEGGEGARHTCNAWVSLIWV